MTKLDVPKIEPINVKQYEFKQSPYPQADKLPFRSIIVSASQGGKVFFSEPHSKNLQGVL